MKRLWILLLPLLLPAAACGQGTLVGGPCEGCEAVFEYGERELAPVDTLPDFSREGPRMKVTGTIYEPDGETPAEDVILYIYHTNQQGIYETRGDEEGWARRHGFIRGWIKTDETGRYTFYTLKPGAYPSRSQAAHIHGTILEPDGRYYWIQAWHFRGAPLLEEDPEESPRGGSGIVDIEREDGMLVVRRDIVLGKNVPGYGGGR